MIQTSARLLKVLALLQSRRFWAGGELAAELGVTERSVRRDVDRLRSLGYPVHATAGVGGGYQLGAGKELPPLPLEDEEALAVAVGLRAAVGGPVRGLDEAAARALGKLEQVLPKRLRRRLGALQEVSVRLGAHSQLVSGETLAAIANACRDCALLAFPYRSRDGVASERKVEPYRLVHSSHRWYMLAYDLDRQEWRTFRVDRVASPPRAGRTFRPRPLPSEDVAGWVSEKIASVPHRFEARATVHAPAAVVKERLGWMSAKIDSIDAERCTVRIGGDRLDWLCFSLGSLGADFEVHEPEALREELRVQAERFVRAAGLRRTPSTA